VHVLERPTPTEATMRPVAVLLWSTFLCAGVATSEPVGLAALAAALDGLDLLELRRLYLASAAMWPPCPTSGHRGVRCRSFETIAQWAQQVLKLPAGVAKVLDYVAIPGDPALSVALRLLSALFTQGTFPTSALHFQKRRDKRRTFQ